MAKVTGNITREWIEKHGIPWPPASRDVDGSEFVSVDEFSIEAQHEDVRWLGPTYPDREVPIAFEYDPDTGDEYATEYRTLSDDEWNAALEAYENAMTEFRKTNGLHRRKAGPDIVRGTFITKHGARARGFLVGGKTWRWDDITINN